MAAHPTISLAALREALAGKFEQTWSWETDLAGISGRALLVFPDGPVQFAMRLREPMVLAGDVRLLPGDWRDGDGAVLATVSAERRNGDAETIWEGELRSAIEGGEPTGFAFSATLPADTTSMTLSVVQLRSRTPYSVGRAAWSGVTLADPNGPPDPTPSEPDRDVDDRAEGPCISIVTPVHDPPIEMLREAVESVLAQTYENWQLCLCDDGSTHADVIAALQRYARDDPRVLLTRNETAGGISAASNAALTLATGEFIALLDHDDTLAPEALAAVIEQLSADPSLDMIYSDEAIIASDGRHMARQVKPDWSPDTMRTNCYTCHLGVYRHALVKEVGGFRSEFDGSQDFDLILRITERSQRVAHIPRMLYNWRAHAGSAAGGIDAKPYAYVAGRHAAAAHVERSGLDAEVHYGPAGIYRIVHRIPERAAVTVAMASGSPADLAALGRSLLEQPHPRWEIALGLAGPRLHDAVAALSDAGVPAERIVAADVPSGTSRTAALNAAVAAGRHEHLLLLESPVVGLTGDWLVRPLGYVSEPGVAASAPVVLNCEHRVLHAGIATPEGTPLHLRYGADGAAAQVAATNVVAVDTAMVTRRETFERLGGLDVEFVTLAFADYCMRAIDEGMRVVLVPDARVQTASDEAPVNDVADLLLLRSRRLARAAPDPYFNPAYHSDRGDFRLLNTETEYGDVDENLLPVE